MLTSSPTPTLDPWHVAVLIPARNEQDLLPRCLRSVIAACAHLPTHITCDIIVAVDCSTDNTLPIARKLLANRGAVVSTDAGIVGRARALAARTALDRYTGPLSLCWFANTDADCAVPPTWLADQLHRAHQGIEALTGIVDVDSFAEHGPAVADRFRASYTLHADGSHPHVHGANIGVRADAYLRAGGWASLATAEDHDLWGRLHTTGSRRQSAVSLSVLTSGRRTGRAPLGFAGALASHNDSFTSGTAEAAL